LQVGDIITQVDNQDITTYEELIDAKNTKRAGDTMTLTVYREGTYLTMVVTLDEEQPDDAAASPEDNTQGQYGGNGYTDPYDFFNDFFGSRGW
jgi:serine protease Do